MGVELCKHVCLDQQNKFKSKRSIKKECPDKILQAKDPIALSLQQRHKNDTACIADEARIR